MHLHIFIHHAKHVTCIFSFKPHQPSGKSTFIALVLQMKKVRNKEFIVFPQDHAAKGWSQDLNPGSLDSEPTAFTSQVLPCDYWADLGLWPEKTPVCFGCPPPCLGGLYLHAYFPPLWSPMKRAQCSLPVLDDDQLSRLPGTKKFPEIRHS